MDWPFGLYGAGMHDWLMDELELGTRVAHFMDTEQNMDPLWWVTAHHLEEWCRTHDENGYEIHPPNSDCI